MSEYPKLRRLLGLVAVVFLGSSIAHAEMGGVQDNAAFFSSTAKNHAALTIGEIERRFKKDLVIETFNEIPTEFSQGVNLQDKTALNRAVEQWATKQARQKRINGIYILLLKQPAHLQVEVGNQTQHKAFTLQDRDNLVRLMLASLRQKQPDEALTSGVNYVLSTISSHVAPHVYLPDAQATTHTAGQALLLKWVLIAIVVWIVLRTVRGLAGGGGGYAGTQGPVGGYGAGPGMPMGGGGGGFFSNMVGGMFGAAAGSWMYDKLSGRDNSSFGSDMGNRGNDGGFSGQDTDYSGSGGDFGDNSGGGGGDFGGGGGGGGDFGGGGDSGGGGGDF